MSLTGTPTNINLNDTNPPEKPDAFNVEWQAGAQYTDPNTGLPVRDASACYRVPQVGGVFVITDDYDLGDVDSGWTFICDSPTPFKITFPPAPPVLKSPANGLWNVKILNIGLGEVTLDLTEHQVEVRDLRGGRRTVQLTPTEFKLLLILARAPGKAFSREELQHSLWGAAQTDEAGYSSVNAHVSGLRERLENDPKHPRYLVTVRNIGYRFDA